MSHVLKDSLWIIRVCILYKCKKQTNRTNFSFHNDLSTGEAIFTLNMLMQRCWDINYDVYACFTGYKKKKKTFNCTIISWLKYLETWVLMVHTSKLFHIYINECKKESVTKHLNIFRLGKEQASIILFNIHSDVIFCESLQDARGDVVVNGGMFY